VSREVFSRQERGLIALLFVALATSGVIELVPRSARVVESFPVPVVVEDVCVVSPVFVAPARVDVNSATAEELTRLSGIGPVLAQRIVAYREAHGLFRSIDALDAVPGVGQATIKGFRDEAVVGDLADQ